MKHKLFFEEGKIVKEEWIEDEKDLDEKDFVMAKDLLRKIAIKNQLDFGYECEDYHNFTLFVSDYKGNKWGETIIIEELNLEGQFRILRKTADIMRTIINGGKSGLLELL